MKKQEETARRDDLMKAVVERDEDGHAHAHVTYALELLSGIRPFGQYVSDAEKILRDAVMASDRQEFPLLSSEIIVFPMESDLREPGTALVSVSI